MLHLDIMDGHLVPNISFGVPVVRSIRRVTELPLDVHLMLSNPGPFLKPFREAGADILTVHIEAAPDPRPLLDEIHAMGIPAGLTLNPPTDVAAIEPFLDQCELVLVMSVMAGFGGQPFEPCAVEKLRRLRSLGGDRLLLSVDGGINYQTVSSVVEAGVDMLVTGSALFSQDDYGDFIRRMTETAREVRGA